MNSLCGGAYIIKFYVSWSAADTADIPRGTKLLDTGTYGNVYRIQRRDPKTGKLIDLVKKNPRRTNCMTAILQEGQKRQMLTERPSTALILSTCL